MHKLKVGTGRQEEPCRLLDNKPSCISELWVQLETLCFILLWESCVYESASLCVYMFSYAFPLWIVFFCLLFALSDSSLFVFILFYCYFFTCLFFFPKERQKGYEFGWQGRWEGSQWGSGGETITWIYNIKIYFQ